MRNPFARNDSPSGSFLPAEYVARKNEMRANIICLSLFGVVMFGVIAAFFVTNRQWLQVRKMQQAITVEYAEQAAKIDQLTKLEAQRSEMIQKAEITNALLEKVPRSVLMDELTSRLPQPITLMEIELKSKRIQEPKAPAASATGAPQVKNLSGTTARAGRVAGAKTPAPKPENEGPRVAAPRFEHVLRVAGVSQGNNEIADYLAALKDCPLLEKVELKFIKETTVDKVDLRKFEIEASIRRDADGRTYVEKLARKQESEQASGVQNAEPVTSPTAAVPEEK